jgi:hypothetical protein
MTMGWPVCRHSDCNSSIRISSARAAEMWFSPMYASTSPTSSLSSSIMSWGSKI